MGAVKAQSPPIAFHPFKPGPLPGLPGLVNNKRVESYESNPGG